MFEPGDFALQVGNETRPDTSHQPRRNDLRSLLPDAFKRALSGPEVMRDEGARLNRSNAETIGLRALKGADVPVCGL